MHKKVIIGGAVFLSVIWIPRVWAAELHIASPSTVVVPGQTFTVGVGLASPVNSVMGTDIWLSYDSSLVDFESAATQSASLPTLAGPKIENNKVGFSLLAFDGNATTSAVRGTWDAMQSPLAQASFRAKKIGKVTLSVDYSAGSTIDSNIVTLDFGSPTDILENPTDRVVVNIAPCILVDDFNYDGRIDIVDLMQMAVKWGTTDVTFDLNNDGIVNIVDLMLEAGKWGSTC